jgi:hypothetical protein
MANAELSLDKAVEDATKANSGYWPDFRENHKEKKPLTLHEGAPSYGRNNELYILHGLSGSRKGLPLLCLSRWLGQRDRALLRLAELIREADSEDNKFRRVKGFGIEQFFKG